MVQVRDRFGIAVDRVAVDRVAVDRGQALPLVALVVTVVAGVLVVAVRLAEPLDDAARARTAADAAALAGVADGPDAAARLARDNGGDLVDYAEIGDEVEVRVQVGAAVAIARAEASIIWLPD